MRRAAATLLFLVTLDSDATAETIFALGWRNTGTQALTIPPGDPAAGGQRTPDIVTTPDVQCVAFGVTVALPEGSSLSFVGGRVRGGLGGRG